MNYDPIILNYGTSYTSNIPNNNNFGIYSLSIKNNNITIDSNSGVINIIENLEVGIYNIKVYFSYNNEVIDTDLTITIKQNIIYNLNNISSNCQLIPILHPSIEYGFFTIDISSSNIIIDLNNGYINCYNLPIDNYIFTVSWSVNNIIAEYLINFTIKPSIYYNINEKYINYGSISFSEKPIINPLNNSFIITSQNKIDSDGILDFSNYDVGLHKILVNITINNITNFTTYNLYILPEINYNKLYNCSALTDYYTNQPTVSQLGGFFSINDFKIDKNTGIICINAPTNIYNLEVFYYKNDVHVSTNIQFIVNPIISYDNILTNSNQISYSNIPISNEVIDGSFNLLNYHDIISIDSYGVLQFSNLLPNIYIVNIQYNKNNCHVTTNCKVTVNPCLIINNNEQTINYGDNFKYINFEIIPENIPYTLICNNPNVLIYKNYLSLENITDIGKYSINLTLTINNQSVYESYSFNILPNIFYTSKINYGIYSQDFISDIPIINPTISSNNSFYLLDCSYNILIDPNTGILIGTNLDVNTYNLNIIYNYLDFKIPINYQLIITPLLIVPNQTILYSSSISGIIYSPKEGILSYELDYTNLNSGNYISNISYTFNNIQTKKEFKLSIFKKKLDLNLIVIDKFYDGTNYANISDISGIIIDGIYDNPNIGFNKNVIINNLLLPEYLNINYYCNIKNLKGNILPSIVKPYIIGFDKIYDGNKNAIVTISCSLVNILSYTSNFTTNNIGLQSIIINNIILDNNNFKLSNPSYTVSGYIYPKNAYAKFNVDNKIYDGSNNCIINLENITGLLNRDFIILNNIKGYFNSSNSGCNQVNITSYDIAGYNSSNYNLIILDFSGNIKPQEIKLQIFSIDKIYDGKLNANIYFNTNFNIVSYNAYYLDKYVNIKKIIKVTDIILEDPNYFVADCTLYGNILPLMLQFDFSGNNKVYDGSTLCTGSYYINSLLNDDINCIFDSNFKNYFYGENKEISITNLKLIGRDSINYKINCIKTNKAIIYKQELFINFYCIDKMYDKTNIAFVKISSISGSIQNVQILELDAIYEDYYCGNNKLITIRNIILEPQFINYFVNDTFCYGNILPRELSLNIKKITKDYDGKTNVNISVNNIINIVQNDVVYIESYNANFTDPNWGFVKIVNINNISLLGDSANNYICNNFKTTGTINQSSLHVNFIALDQEYDINLIPILNCNYDISSYIASYSSIKVGQQKISISNIVLKNSNNYFIPSQIIKGNILPKKINLNIRANDKIFDSLTDATIIYDQQYNFTYNAYFEDPNVGFKNVFITDISLNNNNYFTDTSIVVKANILPQEIVVSLETIEKIYDGNTEIKNLEIAIKNANIISYNANFDDPNYGLNKIVGINNIILNNNNYFIKDFLCPGIIKPAPIDILFYIDDKIYDSTINVNITSISSIINVLSYNAYYNTPNIGINKIIIENIKLADTNYNCNNLLLTSNINPKLLKIEFVIKPKIYDHNIFAIIEAYTILNAHETINIISYSAIYENINVCLQKIIINNIIIDSLNYYTEEYIAYSNINPRLLDIKFKNLNKIYDKTTETNIEINYINNIIDNDVVNVSYFNSYYEDYNSNNNININITNIILVGNDNYYVNNYTVIGNILPKPIECTFSLVNNLIIGSLNGIITTDNLMINNYISYQDNKGINIQNITLTGTNINNYILSNNNYLINNI